MTVLGVSVPPLAWWVYKHIGHQLVTEEKKEVSSVQWPPASDPNIPLPHISVTVLHQASPRLLLRPPQASSFPHGQETPQPTYILKF